MTTKPVSICKALGRHFSGSIQWESTGTDTGGRDTTLVTVRASIHSTWHSGVCSRRLFAHRPCNTSNRCRVHHDHRLQTSCTTCRASPSAHHQCNGRVTPFPTYRQHYNTLALVALFERLFRTRNLSRTALSTNNRHMRGYRLVVRESWSRQADDESSRVYAPGVNYETDHPLN